MENEHEAFDKVWTGLGTFRVGRELGIASLKADPAMVVIRTEQLCCADTYGCPHDRQEIIQLYREELEKQKIPFDESIQWRDLSFALRKIHRVESQQEVTLPCENYNIDFDMNDFTGEL